MRRVRAVSATILAVLLVSTATLPVAGVDRPIDGLDRPSATARDAGRTTGTAAGIDAVAVSSDPSNNSTQHANPGARSREGNLEDLRSWMARRMADQLGGSTLQVSQGEYEAARSVLGNEYDGYLGRYVDIAGETEGSRDDELAETFNETRNAQQKFVSSARRFRNLTEKYQTARQNGNTDRARRLGRRLVRLANTTNQSADEIVTNFGTIANATGTDFDNSTEAVTKVSQNISTRGAEVRSETFVETRLVATAESERISFLDPLRVTARLTAANGSAVANESIRVRIANRTVRTTTNATGGFAFTHRPTVLPTGDQRVQVHYDPENTSVYLGSNGTVDVNVSQVTPTLSVENESLTGGFDENVTVGGTVSAEGVAAARVPVVARLGGQRVGRASTGPNGTFSLNATVPASVPAGERQIRLDLALTERALASTNATANVTIQTTASDLNVTATRAGPTAVRVNGTLASAGGFPVPGQPVQLQLDGTTVATASTGPDGRFATTLNVSSERLQKAGAQLDITAVYAGRDANLEPSRASIVVELPSSGQGTGVLSLLEEVASSPWRFGLLGLAALVTAGLLYGRWRESDTASIDAPSEDDEPEPAGADDETASSGPDPSEVRPALFDQARSQLAAGETNAAVETAYAAMRQYVGDAIEAEDEQTHWEFFNAYCRTAAGDDRTDELRRLTEAYERAAFAGDSVSTDLAESAVEIAARIDASS